jgi:hypothetical protein
MLVSISRPLLETIAAILVRAMHSPTVAFQTYLDENPWSPEAKMYDV